MWPAGDNGPSVHRHNATGGFQGGHPQKSLGSRALWPPQNKGCGQCPNIHFDFLEFSEPSSQGSDFRQDIVVAETFTVTLKF